jgi:hypothetical protein
MTPDDDVPVKFAVPSEEFRTHCQARATHHRGRADSKEKELPNLEASYAKLRELDDDGAQKDTPSNKISRGGYEDDQNKIKKIKAEIQQHRLIADRFAFYETHTSDSHWPTMWLTVEDLERFEFIPKVGGNW